MMAYDPLNLLHDHLRMNRMNMPPQDGSSMLRGRLSLESTPSSNITGGNNNMYFPSEFTRMGLASVEMQMMQSVMGARLRAAQQINELRMLQASNVNPSFVTKSTMTQGYPLPLKGLDLLGSVSTSISRSTSTSTSTPTDPTTHVIPSSPVINDGMYKNKATVKLTLNEVDQCLAKVQAPVQQAPSVTEENGLMYIDSIQEWDVLCGRGGRSNHHPGNKRYRHVVSDMKMMYRRTEAKTIKTDLSRAIVDHVCNYGGRFVKPDSKSGRFIILNKFDARKKTSQALRETKALKWTY
jgi:hypothetical protein